jgi:hypothetical protein
VQALVDNDAMAAAMGRAAAELVARELTPDTVQEYWYRLLTQYAALQDFTPRVHADAVPLEEALVARAALDPALRTCPHCRPPGW